VDGLDPRLLLLSPEDNVVVACRDLPAGAELVVDGAALRLAVPVPTGHKVARRAIPAGEKVVKHGAPIGSATAAIAPGGYVHTHNLRSDYIESTLWDEQR
jgi:altronate dehydratase small subunit